jgi:arylsulfatase A-like enzyme
MMIFLIVVTLLSIAHGTNARVKTQLEIETTANDRIHNASDSTYYRTTASVVTDEWVYFRDAPPSQSPNLRKPQQLENASETQPVSSPITFKRDDVSNQPTRQVWEYGVLAPNMIPSRLRSPSPSPSLETNNSKPSDMPSMLLPTSKQGTGSGTKTPVSSSTDSLTTTEFLNPLTEKKTKPNILLILADDVGTGDIPRYWNSGLVKMPNIDRLSDMGVTFLDAHSTPLCAPSRYMLLSGNYQHRGRNANGSWNLGYENNQFMSNQKSLSEVLKGAGYHTFMTGKWHLGAKVPPAGLKDREKYLTSPWHNWSLPLIDGPQDIGFDHSYITTGGIQEAPYSFFRNGMLTTDVQSESTYWEPGSYKTTVGDSVILRAGEGDISWDSSSYNMILVNETSRFLDEHFKSKADHPFFAYVALGAVHIPHSPPNHYLDGKPVAYEYPSGHLDMLLEMDMVVGSLVSMIETRGVANNTIIIFASDNGGLKYTPGIPHRSSGPLRGQKGEIWEGGHRIPFIMRYDGVFPANEQRDHFVGLNDVYATLCDLAEIDVPHLSAQDSVSFADYILSQNSTENLRNSLAFFDYKKSALQAESLRKGNLKLIRFIKDSSVELYDLKKDISESIDLSKDPFYQDTMQEMMKELQSLGPCPDDVTGFFAIHNDFVDSTFNTTCQFFERKPWKCDDFIEGELNCNSICGRHKKVCVSNF